MSRNIKPADDTPPWLREDLKNNNNNNNIKSVPIQNTYVPPKVIEEKKISNNNNNNNNNVTKPSNNNNNNPTAATTNNTNNTTNKVLNINLPSNEDVPKLIFYTRVVNMLLSLGMLLASLLSLLTTADATTGVLALYTVLFGCLLCCYETHLKQVSRLIARNFGFLYHVKSRCLFMLFIGSIMFSFSLFGKLIGLLMVLNALFNMFLICMYPQYEQLSLDYATNEIQDYLNNNPAFAAQAVSLGVAAGAHIVKNNPEIAQQGIRALMTTQLNTNTNNGYSKVNENAV